MSEEQNKPKKLSLSGSGKLSLGGNFEQAPLRGNAVVGSSRGKTVQVEVRRKRVGGTPIRVAQPAPAPFAAPVEKAVIAEPALADDHLTAAERANRIKVLQDGLSKSSEAAAGLAADKLLDDNATVAVVAEGEAENAVPEIPVVEESPLDPREARRRAELAELLEIEKQASAQRKVHSDKLTAENAA
ncbi:MAG: IF-2-associated domain-containing protein, partial [Alphaproteobacteria bacterium]|nr:IF-2-associated domain-containing protein [Alphaproteobacteria bacterium]